MKINTEQSTRQSFNTVLNITTPTKKVQNAHTYIESKLQKSFTSKFSIWVQYSFVTLPFTPKSVHSTFFNPCWILVVPAAAANSRLSTLLTLLMFLFNSPSHITALRHTQTHLQKAHFLVCHVPLTWLSHDTIKHSCQHTTLTNIMKNMLHCPQHHNLQI